MRNVLFDKLNRVRSIKEEINSKRIKLESLEACLLPGAIRYDVDRVQSTAGDKLPNLMDEILAVRKDIDNLQTDLDNAVKSVSHMIDKLPNINQRNVFYKRYLDVKHFEDISEELSYSIDSIYSMHRKGMKWLSDNCIDTSNQL